MLLQTTTERYQTQRTPPYAPNQVLKISVLDDSLGNSTYMKKKQERTTYLLRKSFSVVNKNIKTNRKFMFRAVATSPENPRESLQRTSNSAKSMPHRKYYFMGKILFKVLPSLEILFPSRVDGPLSWMTTFT